MTKLLNAIFLISGTAIGAGLIALPITSVNLGNEILISVIAFMIFIAYQTSIMTIELNEYNTKPCSIVELSRKMSGNSAFFVSLLSFYILSFSLLCVYLSGISDSLTTFLNLDHHLIVIMSGITLAVILSLKATLFSKLNSILVAILLIAIITSIVQIHISNSISTNVNLINKSEILAFIPIIFTSFGVQNICPYIYNYLDRDKRKIKIAFLIGILIPAIVYISWTSSVFKNIISTDISFFLKLQNHQVEVGELIKFLCESTKNEYMEIFLKILTIFAIITSAIGIGLGLLKSLQEVVTISKRAASVIIGIIPAILVINIQNAFINILSFGGMIATVFVIFVPYYLIKMKLHNNNINYDICMLFGAIVVFCEVSRLFFKVS